MERNIRMLNPKSSEDIAYFDTDIESGDQIVSDGYVTNQAPNFFEIEL